MGQLLRFVKYYIYEIRQMEENLKRASSYSCDILIIGSGSAGLRAAIEAHDAGARVLILCKSTKGDPHTVLARGGINAALGTMDPEDNWMIHAADTLKEGEFLADYERVEALCKNAPDAVNELVKWGARSVFLALIHIEGRYFTKIGQVRK